MRRNKFLLAGGVISILALSASLFFIFPPRASSGVPLDDAAAEGKQLGDTGAAALRDPGDLDSSSSEMRAMIERFTVDRGSLNRSSPISISPMRISRFREFYTEWGDRLAKVDFEAMSVPGRIDYLLFKNYLDYELQQLDMQSQQLAETEPLLPFAKGIIELEESRRRMEPVDSPGAAAALARIKTQIEEVQKRVTAGIGPGKRAEEKAEGKVEPLQVKKTLANRAVGVIRTLRNTLRSWYGFYYGYDPVFTWWVGESYNEVDKALGSYAAFLSEKVLGVKLAEGTAARAEARPGRPPGRGGDDDGGQRPAFMPRRALSARPGDARDIVGDPIGREALMVQLAYAMIPYTPEELIAIGKKEMAWCEAEMVKASRELGYGDDWHKALEYVKTLHVEPGKQPELIHDLAVEAVRFLDDHDLITVEPLAREIWRMRMMSPERQLVNPFFTGGETISVSFPTNTMSHEQKMMSMRGNNIHFARATVFHELIPGHHLQGFMTARYKPYRRLFRTPFWGEGWALYWEMLLWDMNFAKSPENRIGMLFWRMHRCARIIFSLSFHLGQMTPQECIDFLVERVGHERENATAEVRRSFESASPLYQAAYMLGGLQIYNLHKELVDSGKMTNRAFHDAILKENSMPIEMLRALLSGQKLTQDFKSNWKFYGPSPGAS